SRLSDRGSRSLLAPAGQAGEQRPRDPIGQPSHEQAVEDVERGRRRLEERELGRRGSKVDGANRDDGPEHEREPVEEEAREAVSPEAHEAWILGPETRRGKACALPLAWCNTSAACDVTSS